MEGIAAGILGMSGSEMAKSDGGGGEGFGQRCCTTRDIRRCLNRKDSVAETDNVNFTVNGISS